MTSNRGNQHNRISMSFLLAAYQAGDQLLAQKVATSLRKDLTQQMRYYNSLGDNMTNEQLAINAQMLTQGKGGNLSNRQASFANDILSSFQMILQLDEWQKQYGGGARPAAGAPTPGSETAPAVIKNDSPPQAGDQPK
jgi:hypothetical protein